MMPDEKRIAAQIEKLGISRLQAIRNVQAIDFIEAKRRDDNSTRLHRVFGGGDDRPAYVPIAPWPILPPERKPSRLARLWAWLLQPVGGRK